MSNSSGTPTTPHRESNHLITRIVAATIAHPWRAISAWVALVLVAMVLGGMLTTKTPAAADYRVGQSGVADQWQSEAGLKSPPAEFILFEPKAGDTGTGPLTAAVGDIRRTLAGRTEVVGVAGPVPSADQRSRLLVISLKTKANGDAVDIAGLRTVITDAAARHAGVQIRQTGESSLNTEIMDRVSHDLKSAEKTSFPLTFVIMIVVFGALVAAFLPVLVGVTSILIAIGLTAAVSQVFVMEPTAMNMIAMMGMAVGIDYSLFYLKREREERARGADHHSAIRIAAATSGHSIMVSGFAVLLSVGGLLLAGDVTFVSLALGSMLVVAVALLGSVTVLPALLTVLGRWVDRPRIPGLHRLSRVVPADQQRAGRLAHAVAAVVRRPVAFSVAGLVIVGALAFPALHMRLVHASLETLPADMSGVQTMKQMDTLFPSAQPNGHLVVRLPGIASAAEIDRTGAQLRSATGAADGSWSLVGTPQVARTNGVTTLDFGLRSPTAMGSRSQEAAVTSLRTELGSRMTGPWALGGEGATAYDQSEHQRSVLPWVVSAVIAMTALLVGLIFRSGWLGLITTLLNLGSVGAAFGVVTLVFTSDGAADLLGFHNTNGVISWIPLFMFAVLVGLSMDYHVFVLSRIRENVQNGLPARRAIIEGIVSTAGVITSAAVVMVTVFAVFGTLGMVEMKEMGIGLAVAIALDATLVRLVLLPALVSLCSKWIWPADQRAETGTSGGVQVREAEPERTPVPVGGSASRAG